MKFVEQPDLAFPPLAKSFSARIVGSAVLVRAREPFMQYPRRMELDDPMHDLIGGYADRIATRGGWGKSPPHIAFANATTIEKLVAFVGRFGWIHVPPQLIRYEVRKLNGKPTGFWLVRQSGVRLLRERGAFAAAARLLVALQTGGDLVTSYARTAAAFWAFDEAMMPLATLMFSERPKDPEKIGHAILTTILNKFPPRLVAVKATIPGWPWRVHEMPELTTTGLRPFLYGELRRDYMAAFDPWQRPSLGECRRPECSEFFVTERRGQTYCTPKCSRLDRQRAYWSRTGAALRKKRKKAGRTRP